MQMLICWYIPETFSDVGGYEHPALPPPAVPRFSHGFVMAFVILQNSEFFPNMIRIDWANSSGSTKSVVERLAL